MALIVEDGTGVADADSLASVPDATGFQRANNSVDRWNAASTLEVESALRLATRFVCMSWRYHGTRSTTTQALCFPRSGLRDEEGDAVPVDVVPRRVIEAVSLGALLALDGPLIDPRPALTSRRIGDYAETFAGGHTVRDLTELRLLLRPFIRTTVGGPAVDVVRVN